MLVSVTKVPWVTRAPLVLLGILSHTHNEIEKCAVHVPPYLHSLTKRNENEVEVPAVVSYMTLNSLLFGPSGVTGNPL